MSRRQKKELARILASLALLIVIELLPLEGWWRLAAILVPYALCGWDVVWDALRGIARGQMFDEKFLMTLATVGALALGEYAEAVEVMLFYQAGELFENIAVGRSRRNIASLMDIRPDSANVLRGGELLEVAPEEVAVGEEIVIRPGEKIPLDGSIIEGSTAVNAAALTGESLPQDKTVGDRVVSGSINVSGVIHVRTESEFGESTVARILELVENSASRKARVENFITRFARWYTPCVVVAAVLLAVVPPLFAGGWSEWIRRALVFLMVSCPCALVVSVPLTFFGGIGGASRKGILVKGANYLETLAGVKTVVFDKTGTLTRGSFEVTAVHPRQVSEAELLELAAAAESNSSHPIAQSIVEAHGRDIAPGRISEVRERAGLGVEAVIDGRRLFVGNGRLMDEVGAEWHECHRPGTVIHISEGSEYLGHIVISDQPKPDAAEAISGLRAAGVERVVMLTGDAQRVAESVGRELGVDDVRAGLMPADKVSEVEKLIAPGAPLAFVGDGMNDAPVLSRSDVGIAMGALGSDAAIEAADVVLMDDKPSKIPQAMRIARRTMRIVRQNIVLALAVKGVMLVLGAVGLAGMRMAVFADVGVLILAILNAMRALRVD